MAGGRVGEFEGLVDNRFEDPRGKEIDDLAQHGGHLVTPVPQVAEVDPEDSPILTHQIERLERGHPQKPSEGCRNAPLGAGRQARGAKDEEPAEGRETTVALGEGGAADGVQRDVDAAAAGENPHLPLEILGTIIDARRHAHLSQPFVLSGRRGADDLGPEVAADLDRGEADPARAGVDQHPFAGTHVAQTHQHQPRGEVVDRDRGCVLEAEVVRDRSHRRLRDAHHVRVTPESGHADDTVAVVAAFDPLAHFIHHPRHLVAHDRGQLRRVGVETHAGKNIGKVDARRLDLNPHLTGTRLRIRRLSQLEHLRLTNFWNPHLFHLSLFSDFGLHWPHSREPGPPGGCQVAHLGPTYFP